LTSKAAVPAGADGLRRTNRRQIVNQDRGPSPFQQAKAALGWVAFIAGVLAVSVEVFLHRSRSFGERYVGLQGAAVLLIVPVFAAFWPGHDLRPLFWFLAAYLCMCFLVRVGVAIRLHREGPVQHSRYNGYPRAGWLTRRIGEEKVKLMVEPLLVFLAGILTLPYSEPLGAYLMLASAGLSLSVHLTVGYERMRIQNMNDAAIEQRDFAEGFRNRRGDRF
jgi:hypothetical protein